MAVAYWGPATAGGGGGTAADGAGVRGRGKIDIATVEFLQLDASMGLRLRQGRELPRPPQPRPPSGPPRRPGPPPPRLRQGRVTGIIIYLTLKRGGKQYQRSVLPPLLSPPQNSSRRNQYEITKSMAKKDFCTSGRDFLHLRCKNPFQRCKNFNCLVICSTSITIDTPSLYPTEEIRVPVRGVLRVSYASRVRNI